MARLVDSLAQDICYAATRGEWIMPEHLLLSMTVRHLTTGSAELITLLNVFGHCQSYTRNSNVQLKFNKRFSTSPSPNIAFQNNSVIHFCWDDFDSNEKTPSGTGTTHSTTGI